MDGPHTVLPIADACLPLVGHFLLPSFLDSEGWEGRRGTREREKIFSEKKLEPDRLAVF